MTLSLAMAAFAPHEVAANYHVHGIGLMDRFLTQGYMKGLRNLQLLGIARTTLATHIEENHPYNW